LDRIWNRLAHQRHDDICIAVQTYFWAVAERFWSHLPEYRRLARGRDIPIMVLEPITDV
jgi:hypothetical protein